MDRSSGPFSLSALSTVAGVRGLTLVLSGVPTVLAWILLSRALPTEDFAAVALALAAPTILNFVVPALGAAMANAVPQGPHAFAAAAAASLRSSVFTAVALMTVAAALAASGLWPTILGLDPDLAFPMDWAMVVVTATVGLWIVMLIGDRALIAWGQTTKRVWANAVNGPANLVLTIALIRWSDAPSWMYVLPSCAAMLAAAGLSLYLAVRLPSVDPRKIIQTAMHRKIRRPDGSGRLAISLIIVEATFALPLWVIRPLVSHRGTADDVASLSLGLQFSAPVLSIVAVIGQSLWPYYAQNRASLTPGAVTGQYARFAILGLGFGVAFALGVAVIDHIDLTGQPVGWSLAAGLGAFILLRTAWQPLRLHLSAASTGCRLALITTIAALAQAPVMWVAGGHGAGAVGFSLAAGYAVAAALALMHLAWATRRDRE